MPQTKASKGKICGYNGQNNLKINNSKEEILILGM